MSTEIFRGDAVAVAQVRQSELTGTWATNDTITVTINGKTVTYTVGGTTTITAILTGLAAALNASTIPEFAESTWSNADPYLRQTSDTAGRSQTFSISRTTSSSGAVGAPSDSTANSGPSALVAANFDTGALPAAADTCYIQDTSVDLLYNLDALSGTLTACCIAASFTGEIGLPSRDETNDYYQWRPRYLVINVSTLVIGDGQGDGSGRMLIDLGSVQSAVLVLKTAESVEDEFHALRIKGTHASNTLEVYGGSVDVAPEGADTATFATVTVGGDARVRISRRVTLGTLNVVGTATVELESAASLTDITAINVSGRATLIIRGDNTITALKILDQGTVDDRGEGTITTLTKGPNGNYSVSNNTNGVGARTITNTVLAAGTGQFDNANKTCTFTNAIDLGPAGLLDFPNLDLGYDINVQIS